MATRTETISYAHHHTPYMVVEHGGRQWVIREVDPLHGWTVIERPIVEDEVGAEEVPTPEAVPEPVYQPVRYFPLDSVGIAAAAVFLFLALMVGVIAHLTFADVLGCIVGFLVLIRLLEKRRHRTVVYERPDDLYFLD